MNAQCPNCGHPIGAAFTIAPLPGAHRSDCRCATCRPDVHVLSANPVRTFTVTTTALTNAAAAPMPTGVWQIWPAS